MMTSILYAISSLPFWLTIQVSVKLDKEDKAATPIKELLRLHVEPKIKEKIKLAVAEAKASVQVFPEEVKKVTVEPDIAVKLVNGNPVPTKVGSVSSLPASTVKVLLT